MTDDLIRDLEAAGVPSLVAQRARWENLGPPNCSYHTGDRAVIAHDADRILPVLLTGAEVRRELLRAMLDERFARLFRVALPDETTDEGE